MAYVYRHIRHDKNEPFYIGVGTNKDLKREYQKLSRRSNLWNKISAKTSYDVEIMIDDITIEEAKKKEIEFIELYGRINAGTGTLANLTNGGEGCVGVIPTEETRKKISEKLKGRVVTQEQREMIRNTLKGNIVSEETRMKISKTTKGKVFSDEHRKKINDKVARPVYLCNENGDELQWFESIRKAAFCLGLLPPQISMVVRGVRKHTKNQRFKYA
jgi:hypothetical protein